MRIQAEFVDGFGALAEIGPAVAVFGSARTTCSDPMYAVAKNVGHRLAKEDVTVITGGGPGIMGLIGITEGAIPFAVKDLGHTLPGICIGSAVGAALAMVQGVECYVPHGGMIVALATNNVGLYTLDMDICISHHSALDWYVHHRNPCSRFQEFEHVFVYSPVVESLQA